MHDNPYRSPEAEIEEVAKPRRKPRWESGGLGVVMLVTGMWFMFAESLRIVGIFFAILGLTLMATERAKRSPR